MATRSIIIDLSDPAALTPEQRRAELATILAAGVIRHFEQRRGIPIDGRDDLPLIDRLETGPTLDSGESRLEVPPDPLPVCAWDAHAT